MALPFLALAAGAQALTGIGKSIFGGIQAGKANKAFNRAMANRPKYQIPKEYQDVLATYQRLASSNKMPGQDLMESRIGQSTAKATSALERGAISSATYAGGVGSIYEKELEALQNLDLQAQQYKSSMIDKQSQAQLGLGAQKAEQWNINEYVPWQTEMNRLGEQRQAGVGNLFSGLGDITSSLSNFAGTNAYLKAIKSIYPSGIPPIEDLNKYKVGNDVNFYGQG